MSLIMSASPWNNHDSSSKKRVSTMRKPIKKSSNATGEDNEQEVEAAPLTTFEEDQQHNNEREERVSKLLNNMSFVLQENDGNKLADFQPIPLPDMQKKTDTETASYGRNGDDELSPLPHHVQLQPPKMTSEPSSSSSSSFSPSSRDLGKPQTMIPQDPYSNYRKIYEPSRMRVQNRFGYEEPSISSSMLSNDKLMEKINYMIYLLEQQQHEKTSNITEEFILYTFLGIFIIFVVDSFARSGRYVR